jgi:hypothetical protein
LTWAKVVEVNAEPNREAARRVERALMEEEGLVGSRKRERSSATS